MRGYGFGAGALMSYAGPVVIRSFDLGNGQAAKDRELVDTLVNAPDLDSLYERLVGGFSGFRAVEAQQNRVNRLMFREAERVALLAPELRSVVAASERFYARVVRLEMAWREREAEAPSAVARLRERLSRSVAG